MRKTIITATIALSFFSLSLFGQSDLAGRNDVIQADVINAISRNVHYSIYDIIGVEVDESMVTLSGIVTQPYKKKSFEKQITNLVGEIRTVVSKIEVLPPSAGDDRIRYLLARSIYGDDRLLQYAISRWPYPIHIIVKRGHVILEGEVNSRLDSRIIESKVRSMFGILTVTNNLSVS